MCRRLGCIAFQRGLELCGSFFILTQRGIGVAELQQDLRMAGCKLECAPEALQRFLRLGFQVHISQLIVQCGIPRIAPDGLLQLF